IVPPTLAETALDPSPVEQLRRDLRGVFTNRAVEQAQWAVQVYSLQEGELLYSIDAFRFMVPASTAKLYTVAAAAATLGWDYRFTTTLHATGPIDSDGTLKGDLVIVGNGDPTINPRHPDRWRAFDEWAAELASRGVRVIGGNLVGDDR